MVSKFAVTTCLLLLGSFPAHAGFISAPIHDWDIANTIGGGDICTSAGSYDADTFAWQQTFETCNSAFMLIEDSGFTGVNSMSMSGTGLVDNSGNVLAGTFAWYGAIPDLGINEISLLGSGSVLDVWYGRLEEEGNIPGTSVVAELDFLADPLEDYGFGTIFEWFSYVTLEEWESPVDFPQSKCSTDDPCPWESSLSFSAGDAYTGTTFWSYDRAVLVPEPDTLGLFVLGLTALGFMRHRGRTSRQPRAKGQQSNTQAL